jgi:transposase
VVVDRSGPPLACRLTGANRHDSVVCAELIDAIPPIRQANGRRRKRPTTRHADTAYAIPRCRRALMRRPSKGRIARKGVARRDRRGRPRWVVARTLAWLGQFRRLAVRDERRADIHLAFLALGCARVCFNALIRF